MKKYCIIFWGGLCILAHTSCHKLDLPEDVPKCVEKRIKKMQRQRVANPPLSVWRYKYQGRIVYYIPSQCCDVSSELLDENCSRICSPDGGFTGKGDGLCPVFFSARTEEKLIWKDSR